jgi:iron complex outermembrane receptor protein
VGEQRGRGLELDVPVVISRQWRLLTSYTWVDAIFSRDLSLQGRRIANAPKHSASVWTTYDFASTLRGFSVGLGMQYMGARAANNANAYELPSYTRWDANTTYRFGPDDRYKLQVNLQNLTNERYYDSGGAFVPIYPGAPRNVRVGLGVTF